MRMQSESSSTSCAEAGADTMMRTNIALPLSNSVQKKTLRLTPRIVHTANTTPTDVNAANVTLAAGVNTMSENIPGTRRVSGSDLCDLDASMEDIYLEKEPMFLAFVAHSVGKMECGAAQPGSAAIAERRPPHRTCTDMPLKSINMISRISENANSASIGPSGQPTIATPTAVDGGALVVLGEVATTGGSITGTTTACGSFGRSSPVPADGLAETIHLKSVMGRTCEREIQQQQEEASSFSLSCSKNDAIAASSRSSTASGRAAATVTSAASQSTPFQFNRYFLLLLHVLYVFASARVLFGWPNLSNMLFRSGAFAWLCSDTDSRPDNARYICQAQDNAVQLLFTIGIASSFCCSLLAGIVMDWRGPRFCAVVGQILNTAGWIFLGVANQNCQTYIVGVVCLALGADAGYLPSLTVSNLFPGHEGLVVVVMSAAMSASFSIPTLMDISWRQHPETLSFKTVCLLYAGLGTGLCALVAALLFPRKPYVSQEELTVTTPQGIQRHTGTKKEAFVSSPCENTQRDLERRSSQVAECKCSSGYADDTAMCYSSSTSAAWSRDAPLTGREEGNGVETERGEVESRERRQEEEEEEKGEKVGGGVSETKNRCLIDLGKEDDSDRAPRTPLLSSSIPFRRQLQSSYFLCFLIYWPLNALFYNFYVTSAENMFNRNVNDLLGILGPLSMIPSVLLGKLADAYGVMSLVLFISSSAVGMYIFALIPFVWAYYISAVFSCLYVSNFSGQMYAYMRDTFHTSHFGRVVGITSAAGGLLALLRIPLHDSFTVVVLKGNYRTVCGMMLGVTLFCLLLAVKLYFVKRRKSKAYEPDSHDVRKKEAHKKQKEEATAANGDVLKAPKEKDVCEV